MTSFLSKRPSLSRDYTIFAIIAIIAIILVAIFTISTVYKSYIKNNNQILIKETKQIYNVINESFSYTNHINSHIGKQIADSNDASDLKFIYNLFLKEDDIPKKNNEIFSWSSFDWVNDKGFQTVNSRFGIRKNPPDMNIREYTKTSPKYPWTLQVATPAIGNPSGVWTIPAGTGITNNKGKYLGAIVVGFNINELTNKISSRLINNINFVVLDKHLNIIMQFKGNSLTLKSDFYKNHFESFNYFNQTNSFLKDKIKTDNFVYSYYHKMDDYPYVILTGFDKNFISKEFNAIVLPRILELIFIAIFFVILLYSFRKKIVSPITKLSNTALKISMGNTDIQIPHFQAKEANSLSEALLYVKRSFKKEQQMKEKIHQANLDKTEFLAHTSHELRNPLGSIISICELMSEDYKKSKLTKDEMAEHRQYLEMMNVTGKECLAFLNDLMDITKAQNGNFTLNKKKDTDVKKIIEGTIKLYKIAALKAEIEIKFDIDKNLPNIFCDRQRMKQIMLNIISNSIKYSPKGTIINILTKKKKDKIEITIQDQGFGMSKNEINIALSKYGIVENENSDSIDSFGLGLPLVKYLVELHDGEFLITSKKNQGTKITMIFNI